MGTNHRDTVAANVRAEVARRRARQTDLAALLGISQQAMSRRLTGEVAFDVDELQALASHLEVPASELLGEVPA